jgi:hypothetical protein
MPRYFFNFHDGPRSCPDADGLELPDDAAAWEEARLMARDLRSEPTARAWTVQVTDGTGRRVTTRVVRPASKLRRLARTLDDWLKRVCRHPGAISLPPPSPADRASVDPPGRLPERILRSHAAGLRETSDKA